MIFSLRGIAWIAFAAAVALVVGCSVFLYRATNRLSASDALVNHTHEVETTLEDLEGEVFRASNSAQNFALTGDSASLSGYNLALQNIPQDLGRLQGLTADNPERGMQLSALRDDIQSELAFIASFIESHKKGTSSIDVDAHMARKTADIQDQIGIELQEIHEGEEQLLHERVRAARSNYLRALRLIAILVGIALFLLALQTFLLDYSFSEYRKTESAARRSREIVNAFFSSSTVGFGILDSDLRYARVNDVLPRMAAIAPQDLLGKSVLGIFGLEGRPAETVLREVLRTGLPVLDHEISAELRSQPGQMRHWLVNYFPVPNEKGEFTQMGIIAVDVTARREAESALRRLSGRLLGVQDQERRRIARELHDSLGQYLAGLKIAIELLGATPGPEQRAPLLDECRSIVEKAIVETRTLSHLLHPPLLDEAGFSSAASWFVDGFSQRSGIPVSLDLPPDLPRLPQPVEIALFRILQESLTNVHRHAHTRSAEIKVEADAEHTTIEVIDHGQGMSQQVLENLSGGPRLGVGLAGMRERVRELGGEFEVTSGAQGTVVRARIPLPKLEMQAAIAGTASHAESN